MARFEERVELLRTGGAYSPDSALVDKALAIGKFVAFNCRLHSIMTFELLTAAGIKARYITCLPQDENDNDCHVVNEVWFPETIPALKKEVPG